MDFSQALLEIKAGRGVARTGWNGKGMYVFLIEGRWYRKPDHLPELPFLAMRTAQGQLVPWLASQTDLLAEDWSIVKG